jgi:plasmid maintenance system antidote protein VapI
MSAGFWMNLQLRWDLYQAQQREVEELAAIKPYKEKLPAAKHGSSTKL